MFLFVQTSPVFDTIKISSQFITYHGPILLPTATTEPSDFKPTVCDFPADTAIIYDPWWNPAIEKQAEDRIYRIGQKNKVTIFKLIATDTIEEKVQTLQETKKRLFDEVLQEHDVPHNISMEDIRNLLN